MPGDAPTDRSRTFYRIRVAVLLVVLLLVCGYAWRDVRSRSRRTEWSRPLSIAFVFVAPEPLDPDVRPALLERETVLETRLADEMRRYDERASLPFVIEIVGPVPIAVAPPAPPRGSGVSAVFGTVRYAWDLWRFTSAVDDAAGLDADRYDSRIYVVARPSRSEERKMIEGASQDGGRVGVVACDIDAQTVDFTLFVATHELFHTLGASDKYDADHLPLVPDGLADPARSPLYPQERAELMAGTRPLSERRAALPRSLDELVIGPLTASEIGWTQRR